MKALLPFLAWLVIVLAVGAREPQRPQLLFVGEGAPRIAAMAQAAGADRHRPVTTAARSMSELAQADIDRASIVVLIGVTLPAAMQSRGKSYWRWEPAPTPVLRGRVEELLDALGPAVTRASAAPAR